MAATVGGYTKRLVGHPAVQEEGTQQMAVDAGPAARVDMSLTFNSVYNVGQQGRENLPSLFLLLLCHVGRVNCIDEREKITLGHDDREHTVGLQSDGAEVTLKVVERQAYIVAAGGKDVAVVPFGIVHLQLPYKLAYEKGWTPAVYRETEAQPLALCECTCRRVVVYLSNIDDLLPRGCPQLLGEPSSVAGAREVENHRFSNCLRLRILVLAYSSPL